MAHAIEAQETKSYLDTDYSEGMFQKTIWRHYFDKFLVKNLIDSKDKTSVSTVPTTGLLKLHEGLEIAEVVGFCCSIIALFIAVIVLFFFGCKMGRRTFLIHGQLVLALLLMYFVQVILYGDQMLEFTPVHEYLKQNSRLTGEAYTKEQSSLHFTKGLCEFFYFLYELFKTSAFFWLTVEACHLLYKIGSIRSFAPKQRITLWSCLTWLFALLITVVWIVSTVGATAWKWKVCLGPYMTYKVFWVLEGIRVVLILGNLGIVVFALFVVLMDVVGIPKQSKLIIWFQLWLVSSLSLLFLIPLILRHISFDPVKSDFTNFEYFSYTSLLFHMFLGFLVAVILCFSNPSVWKECLNTGNGRGSQSLLHYEQASQSDRTEKTFVYYS